MEIQVNTYITDRRGEIATINIFVYNNFTQIEHKTEYYSRNIFIHVHNRKVGH